jgi:hypothetical protein
LTWFFAPSDGNATATNPNAASGWVAFTGFVLLEVGFDATQSTSRAWALACLPPHHHTAFLQVGVPASALGTLPVVLLGTLDINQYLGVDR